MDALVARQPIFDRSMAVIGYELLYRPNPGSSMRDDSLATAHVISGAMFDIGLDVMLNGHRGLINVTGELLLDPRLRALPQESFGLEVLETTTPTKETLQACKELREMGFLVALDDYTGQPELAPFLGLVDWVKVDFRVVQGPVPNGLGRKHPTMRPKLLAEKLETEAEFDRAVRLGYDYFQGYFLERPKILSGRRISSSETSRLRLLEELAKPDLDLRSLEQSIETDVSLCLRLLRFANSARFSHANQITSLRHCLVQLGEVEIRRWIALSVLPDLASDRPRELLETAIVRARMCEKLMSKAGHASIASQAFLLGVLSLLEAILRRPFEQVAEEARLPDLLVNALMHRPEECLMAHVLNAAEHYEHGEWEDLESETRKLGLAPSDVCSSYLESIEWAKGLEM